MIDFIIKKEGMCPEDIVLVNIIFWLLIFCELLLVASIVREGIIKDWVKETFDDTLKEPSLKQRIIFFAICFLGGIVTVWILGGIYGTRN